MTFSEYALGLSPFISYGKSEHDYFTELVGSFVKDAAMDSCKVLKRQKDTKYRYIKGTRSLPTDVAQYIYDHRDKDKFANWIWSRMDESDSYDNIIAWLAGQGVETEEPEKACGDLFETLLLDIINSDPCSTSSKVIKYDLSLIDDIQKKIKSLPQPADVPVPEVATKDEQTYINELYSAYGEAEGVDGFSAEDLPTYPDYASDMDDRRIDFYAAESINRGVLELGDGTLSGQFGVLKDETLSGVKDTARRTHANGYERMLAVMEQAVLAPVTNYLLSASPYWISGKIKKGVCHHLVNDGKLKWVRRSKK